MTVMSVKCHIRIDICMLFGQRNSQELAQIQGKESHLLCLPDLVRANRQSAEK